MQVNINVDSELLEKAMLLSHSQNASELLQQALQVFVKTQEQQALLAEMWAIAERCAALPDVDTRSESDILGYNSRGLFTNGD